MSPERRCKFYRLTIAGYLCFANRKEPFPHDCKGIEDENCPFVCPPNKRTPACIPVDNHDLTLVYKN